MYVVWMGDIAQVISERRTGDRVKRSSRCRGGCGYGPGDSRWELGFVGSNVIGRLEGDVFAVVGNGIITVAVDYEPLGVLANFGGFECHICSKPASAIMAFLIVSVSGRECSEEFLRAAREGETAPESGGLN